MAVSLSARKGTSAKTASRLRRQIRVRKKIFGAPERPRLVVSRSAKHITVQLIDDTQGRTLVSASTMEAAFRSESGDKTAKAKQVGAKIAERAKAAGIDKVVFDRAGYRYHGRIAALADGAREAGLGL